MSIIKLKRTYTPNTVPAVADIEDGELINVVPDGRIFLKKVVGGVKSIVRLLTSEDTVSIPVSTKVVDFSTLGFISGSYIRISTIGRLVMVMGEIGLPNSGAAVTYQHQMPATGFDIVAPAVAYAAAPGHIVFASNNSFMVFSTAPGMLLKINFTYWA